MLWNITKGVGGEILLRPVIVSSLKISYFRLLVYFIAFELNVIVHLDIFLSELDQKKKKKNDIYAAPTRVYAQQDSFVYFRKI